MVALFSKGVAGLVWRLTPLARRTAFEAESRLPLKAFVARNAWGKFDECRSPSSTLGTNRAASKRDFEEQQTKSRFSSTAALGEASRA